MEAVTAYQSNQLVNLADYAMSKDAMIAQVRAIQDTLNNVMKEGEHYGKIPGCGNKPTLLKPGAEKISTTFHLAPSYDIITTNMPNAHREYQVVCTLKHIITQVIVGQGVGSCSTMEGKFRYRTKDTDTGELIPKDYKENKGAYRERGFKASKDFDGKWHWVKTERIEHDNPADYYNTCLKMAKKRAHVDAVLTATAASDIFTQDIEDMTEVIEGEIVTAPQEEKPVVDEPEKVQGASEKQIDFIRSILQKKIPDQDELLFVNDVLELIGTNDELESLTDLTKEQARKVFDYFEVQKWTKAKEKK